MRKTKVKRSGQTGKIRTGRQVQKNVGNKRSLFSVLVGIISFPFCVLGDIIVHRPKQSFVAALLGGVSLSIVINAVAFQKAPHPAPLFVQKKVTPPQTVSRNTSPRREIARVNAERAIPEVHTPEETPITVSARPSTITNSIEDGEEERFTQNQSTDSLQQVMAGSSEESIPLPPIRNSAMQASVTSVPRNDRENTAVAANTVEGEKDQKKVREAQLALVMLGYGQISVDGLWGPATKKAIESFERDKGLPVTGEINPQTFRALSLAIKRPTAL